MNTHFINFQVNKMNQTRLETFMAQWKMLLPNLSHYIPNNEFNWFYKLFSATENNKNNTLLLLFGKSSPLTWNHGEE
jgi:hypothetical protein